MLGDPKQSPKILINVERRSDCFLQPKWKIKKAKSILETTEELFEEIPDELCLSITYDNGTEFAKHQEIESSLDMKVYFAKPYSPWQRGT